MNKYLFNTLEEERIKAALTCWMTILSVMIVTKTENFFEIKRITPIHQIYENSTESPRKKFLLRS